MVYRSWTVAPVSKLRHVSHYAEHKGRAFGPGLGDSPEAAPGLDGEAEALPDQVGGKYQEPGDGIAGAYLLAKSSKKLTVSVTTEGSKQALSNPEYTDGHKNKSKKQESGEKSDFLADYLLEGGRF